MEMSEVDIWMIDDDEFPKKSDFGSMQRKRWGMKYYKYKLLRMCHACAYPSHAFYVDRYGKQCEKEQGIRLKRLYREKRSKKIKRICNRRVRHSDFYGQNNLYRRYSEFWWEYD